MNTGYFSSFIMFIFAHPSQGSNGRNGRGCWLNRSLIRPGRRPVLRRLYQGPPPTYQGGPAPLNVPVSTGISTEEVDFNGAICRTPPPMTPASKKFNSFLAQAELDRASDKQDIKSMFSSLKSELFSSIKELTSLSLVFLVREVRQSNLTLPLLTLYRPAPLLV